MKLRKLSFFKRMVLAVTDFRMYPFTQKEKVITALSYFFKLILLVSVILSAFLTVKIFKQSPLILDIYNQYMPEYEVVEGKLSTLEITEKEINDDWYLVINPDYKYNQLESMVINEEKDHNYYVIILSDVATVLTQTNEGIFELGGIQFESNMNFNKEMLANDWQVFNDSIGCKLMIWGVSLIAITFIMVIVKLWATIMQILSVYIINFIFGLRLKFGEALRVAIYAGTLPLLLETIALIVVGSISETINFISVLLSCVYIFYALRALKLDSLIFAGSGKKAEEKIKNALAQAQEELEKQLTELEEKDGKEDAKKKAEEKQAIEDLSRELREKEENLIKAQREYQEVIKKAMDIHAEKENKKDE